MEFFNEYIKMLIKDKYGPNKKMSTLIVDGIKKPEIIIPNGRGFMVIKESLYEDDKNNVGLIFRDKYKGDDDNSKYVEVTNNLEKKLEQMGGSQKNYNKYLKYKNKYLRLKNQLS
jgi:hypothetical protein